MLSQNCKISLMFALYHIASIKIFFMDQTCRGEEL